MVVDIFLFNAFPTNFCGIFNVFPTFGALFEPECFNGVEAARLAGRVPAEEHAGRKTHAETHHHACRRNNHGPVEYAFHDFGSGDAEGDSCETAEEAYHDGFDEELQEDVAAAGAYSHAEADFLGALGDRHIHDVHDADAAYEQTNPCDGGEHEREHVGGARDHGNHFFLGEYAERVGGACPTAALLEDSHDFFGRFFGIAFADGVAINLADVCCGAEAFHHGLVGRKDDVVLVLAEIAGAFQFERPDDFEGDAFVAYGLADGIPFGEQVLDDALAYNADFCHAVGFIVEHDAVFDFVVADFEVVRGDAAQLRGGVVVPDDGLATYGNHGGDGVDVCRLFAKFQDVFFFEGFGGFHLHTTTPVAVRHDDDGVRAHGGHLVLDAFFGAFAHGDHGDDGCDTDDDTEYREKCAHAVAEQCFQGDFNEG